MCVVCLGIAGLAQRLSDVLGFLAGDAHLAGELAELLARGIEALRDVGEVSLATRDLDAEDLLGPFADRSPQEDSAGDAGDRAQRARRHTDPDRLAVARGVASG